jgi:hypothetical protein
MATDIENIDSLNDEGADDEIDAETDPEKIKAKAKDLKEKNKKLYARTKKAEGFELKDGKWVKPTKPADASKASDANAANKGNEAQYTLKDSRALDAANVHEEDVDEVANYAKYKGISIADALKDPIIKSTLKEKSEQRATAAAANGGTARRGAAKISDEKLLEDASKGLLPDSDEDARRLVQLQSEKGRRKK